MQEAIQLATVNRKSKIEYGKVHRPQNQNFEKV